MIKKEIPSPISSEVTPPANLDVARGDWGEIYVLPMSLGQERYWLLDRMNPGNPTWNVPVRFRLLGPLDPAVVARAFNEIIRRHEILRTTFTIADGKLCQVIRRSLEIEVPVTDLRHIAKPERDAEVDRLSFQEARWRFDLAKGPLFRASLLRAEDNEHVLLVTPHHSVVDYWSIGLISNELGALYEAYSHGRGSPLPELAIQYGDYAIWQREQAESEVVQNELSYWKKQLQNLPLLEFPTDRPRPSFPTYDATITSILLPVQLTDAIRDIANREGATFFNTMLAALSIVLQQYSGQTDFGVATQVAGRTNVETESLVGLFINTVVLRMDLSGDPSFSDLVGRAQETGLQSIAHQNLRFEQLLKELRPNEYPSHHTLFRINFICQRDPVKPLEFSGIKLTVIPSKSQGALYDLNVFLVLRNEGWRLACEYNTDLFEARTITRLLADYRKILEEIASNPNRQISEFPRLRSAQALSLGAAAAQELVGSHNQASPDLATPEKGTADAYAMPASVAQRRFWVLEEFSPGNPALHMRACVRLKGSLSQAALGKSLQLLVERHETLRTSFQTINDELVQLIAPTGNLPLTVTSLEDMREKDQEQELWKAIRSETAAPFDWLHGPLIRARLFRLGPGEHVLVITTHHILVDGWSQNVIQRDLWAIYDSLVEGRERSLPTLAIQYGDFVHWQQEWLASDAAKEELDFWRNRLEPPLPILDLPTDPLPQDRTAEESPMATLLLPEDLTQALKAFSKSEDVSMFMLMLTAYSSLLHRYTNQNDFVVGSPVANRRPETEPLIGPFSGPVCLRMNFSGNPTVRELLHRTRDMTLEALSHAELPFEVLLEELAVRWVRGRNPLSQTYFFYQTAFLQPRELRDLTVVPMPDFGLGTHFELQMGLLERREGVRCQLEYNPKLFELATVRNILGDYKTILEAMLEHPDTRIDDLPVSIQIRPAATPVEKAPLKGVTRNPDEMESRLIKIWEEVLHVRSVHLRDNYFELGGTSLLAVRLFAQIENAFKVKLPLSTLFEAQTVEEFAQVLRRTGRAQEWSPLVAIQPAGSRPPMLCVHAAGGNVLIYRALSKHLGSDQPFYGLQAQGVDGTRPFLTRVEEMAALYVKEIRRFQPHGPYYLGGYCLGGTIALEMAQQLRDQGEPVALLALFDTMNWSNVRPLSIPEKARHQTQRLIFHIQNFLLLDFTNKVNFFREKWKTLQSRTGIWWGMLRGKMTKGRLRGTSASSILAQIWEINDRAALNYVARQYSGIITDFRPIKQYPEYEGPEVKWDSLAREGQEIVTLPVYSAGMLLEPFVKDLAAALRKCIDKARDSAEVSANG